MDKHILTTSQNNKTIILTTTGTITIKATSLTKTIIRTRILIVIIIKVKIIPGARAGLISKIRQPQNTTETLEIVESNQIQNSGFIQGYNKYQNNNYNQSKWVNPKIQGYQLELLTNRLTRR